MRLLNYRNKDTKETTTSFAVAENWKNKEIFFTEVVPPIGSEEEKENKIIAEKNIGKKFKKVEKRA